MISAEQMRRRAAKSDRGSEAISQRNSAGIVAGKSLSEQPQHEQTKQESRADPDPGRDPRLWPAGVDGSHRVRAHHASTPSAIRGSNQRASASTAIVEIVITSASTTTN